MTKEGSERFGNAPTLKQHLTELVTHGHTRIDKYYWLQYANNDEVADFSTKENQYTEDLTKHLGLLAKTLREEFANYKLPNYSESLLLGDYEYYTKTTEFEEFYAICRRSLAKNSQEKVLLNLNVVAKDSGYVDLGVFAISPNHDLVAYTLDLSGREYFTAYIKNIATGKYFESLDNVASTLIWCNDNETLYYLTIDETNRPCILYRHNINKRYMNDEKIYVEPDKRFRLKIRKTRDKQYIIVTKESFDTSESFTINANNPHGHLQSIQKLDNDRRYYVEHWGSSFIILVETISGDQSIIMTPETSPGIENWKNIVTPHGHCRILGIDVFNEFLAVHEVHEGIKKLKIYDFVTSEAWYVEFPEAFSNYSMGSNLEFNSRSIQILYNSWTIPPTLYSYLFPSRKVEISTRDKLVSFSQYEYKSQQIFAYSKDGQEIPITLVYKENLNLKGQNPCLLFVYGSYGICPYPQFDECLFSLLDRGFVFTIAHVRGGGERGKQWHEKGRGLKKQNTVNDYIACIQKLVADRITTNQKICLYGGSAGGFTIAAAINQVQDLCGLVVVSAPFVDLVATLLNESLPLTVNDRLEWGDPNQRIYYDNLLKISPYDNITRQKYPNILLKCSINDARVPFWEGIKWAYKIRENNLGNTKVLMKILRVGGHDGSSNKKFNYEETAFDFAFILWHLGISD
jgi:oligopeptidase B